LERKISDATLRYIKLLPIVALIAIGLFIGLQYKDISVEQIVSYTPKNPLMAASVIIGLYGLKSISIVFPLIVLHISAGMIFSPFWAIVINLVGTFVASVIPFLIGRLLGRDFVINLMKRYKKFGEISRMSVIRNQCFFSYFLRVISILPGDLVSLFLGSIGLRFTPYITGSLLGILPGMLATTFIGATITDPTSPEFIISIVITALLSVISYIIYRKFRSRQ